VSGDARRLVRLPIVGNLDGVAVQSLEEPDPRAARGGTTTPHVPRQPQKAVTGRAARPGAFPMPMVVAPSTGAMNRATIGVTVHAPALPRATVIGDPDGHPTRYEAPGPSRLLLEEKSNKCADPPCGVAIATSIY